jgi:hypothetical protein
MRRVKWHSSLRPRAATVHRAGGADHAWAARLPVSGRNLLKK